MKVMTPYEVISKQAYGKELCVWSSLDRNEIVGEFHLLDMFFVVSKPFVHVTQGYIQVEKKQTVIGGLAIKHNKWTAVKEDVPVTLYFDALRVIGATKEVAGYLMFKIDKADVNKPRHVNLFREVVNPYVRS